MLFYKCFLKQYIQVEILSITLFQIQGDYKLEMKTESESTGQCESCGRLWNNKRI